MKGTVARTWSLVKLRALGNSRCAPRPPAQAPAGRPDTAPRGTSASRGPQLRGPRTAASETPRRQGHASCWSPRQSRAAVVRAQSQEGCGEEPGGGALVSPGLPPPKPPGPLPPAGPAADVPSRAGSSLPHPGTNAAQDGLAAAPGDENGTLGWHGEGSAVLPGRRRAKGHRMSQRPLPCLALLNCWGYPKQENASESPVWLHLQV